MEVMRCVALRPPVRSLAPFDAVVEALDFVVETAIAVIDGKEGQQSGKGVVLFEWRREARQMEG